MTIIVISINCCEKTRTFLAGKGTDNMKIGIQTHSLLPAEVKILIMASLMKKGSLSIMNGYCVNSTQKPEQSCHPYLVTSFRHILSQSSVVSFSISGEFPLNHLASYVRHVDNQPFLNEQYKMNLNDAIQVPQKINRMFKHPSWSQ